MSNVVQTAPNADDEAGTDSAVAILRPRTSNTERVLRNAAVDRLIDKEKALGDKIGFADIIEEVAGVYPKIMREGAMDAGAWSCGMVAGLIHDVPPVQELIDRIMAEAEALITERLAGFAAADVSGVRK